MLLINLENSMNYVIFLGTCIDWMYLLLADEVLMGKNYILFKNKMKTCAYCIEMFVLFTLKKDD